MSIPISTCTVCRAALGDEVAFSKLVKAMKYNLDCGHWSQLPCKCEPPCPKPTEEQLEKMNDRMELAIKEMDDKNKNDNASSKNRKSRT